MLNTFRFALFCASFSCLPLLAISAPKLDREVQNFMLSPVRASQNQLPVLLVYKKSESLLNAKNSSRPEREMAMIRQAKSQEQLVFNGSLLSLAAPQTLWIANGSLAHLSQAQIYSLLGSENIESIHFVGKKIKLTPPPSEHTQIAGNQYTYGLRNLKVPELNKKYPQLTGAGIKVGILDSGIDADHPDLKGKVKLFKDFSSEKSPVPVDPFQHGTHVAGTIAGGTSSGEAIGVAPQAQLIIGRIFDGEANSETVDILRAMQWMADPDENPATNDFPAIVNSSWGDSDPYADRDPQDDPFCKVVDSWLNLGIIGVFSAGNSGSQPGSTGLPAGCPNAFAVGATNINDQSPWFSSSGPAIWKSIQIVKPEIAAPGMDIKSAKPRGGYQDMSGTSMSAPHISGSFALLLQAKPTLTVEEAEKAMIDGAKDLGEPGKDNDFGWGRPDLLKSVDLLMPSSK